MSTYDVKLPDIGEGVAEGEIVHWLVKAGDAVKEEQPLVEVMTDKATVEIPSPRTGTIAALHVEEGAIVPVGTVIISIAPEGAAAGASEERIAVRGLRRKIAEHMKKSLATAASYSFVAECDFTALAAHRERSRAAAEAAQVRLTYLAYVLRAVIEPLQRFPLLNSSL